MRILVLVTIMGFAVMYGETVYHLAKAQLGPAEPHEVAAALELRCGDAAGLEQRHCEDDLRKAFSSGARDAGDIVRMHCTRFDNGWAASEDDSEICPTQQEG